jgi:CheY-like chemotaxis protein
MPSDSSTTFLVVEDEENDVFFLERAARKAGVKNPIQVVSSGDEAVDYLTGHGKFSDRIAHPLPSMVFLDLHLPGKSGLEVLTWLRKQPQLDAVIVILLTSSKEEEEIATAYELGANSYLVKPPTVDSLMVLINALDQYEAELGSSGSES